MSRGCLGRRVWGWTVIAVCTVPVGLLAQHGSDASNQPLRAELLQLEREDQADRAGFGSAVNSNDSVYAARLAEADARRQSRLKAIVADGGWPSAAAVGTDGVEAAWMLLQHATDNAWQASMLPVLDQAANAGDIRRSDVALLTDRVLVRSGRPQRYGSSFSIVAGKGVADPIEDEAQWTPAAPQLDCRPWPNMWSS